MILANASKYFETAFKSVNTNEQLVVILKDVLSEDFKVILQFIYCGFANVYERHLERLLSTAQYLGIHGLNNEKAIPEREEELDFDVDFDKYLIVKAENYSEFNDALSDLEVPDETSRMRIRTFFNRWKS